MPPPRGAGSITQVQVWVVGRHNLVNQAFEALLLSLPGVEIAGQAASLEEISPQSLEAEAFPVLWILPAATDFETLSAIQTQHLPQKVLLFSMDWTEQLVQESLETGAVGCLRTIVEELAPDLLCAEITQQNWENGDRSSATLELRQALEPTARLANEAESTPTNVQTKRIATGWCTR